MRHFASCREARHPIKIIDKTASILNVWLPVTNQDGDFVGHNTQSGFLRSQMCVTARRRAAEPHRLPCNLNSFHSFRDRDAEGGITALPWWSELR
jgi:hypothetical protein